jgi:hypothetical protein
VRGAKFNLKGKNGASRAAECPLLRLARPPRRFAAAGSSAAKSTALGSVAQFLICLKTHAKPTS